MPRLRAMPIRRSPAMDAVMQASVAATRISPGFAASSAANSARLSPAPQWQVIATPTITDVGGINGLIRRSSAPRPPRASTACPVGTLANASTASATAARSFA